MFAILISETKKYIYTYTLYFCIDHVKSCLSMKNKKRIYLHCKYKVMKNFANVRHANFRNNKLYFFTCILNYNLKI